MSSRRRLYPADLYAMCQEPETPTLSVLVSPLFLMGLLGSVIEWTDGRRTKVVEAHLTDDRTVELVMKGPA